MPSDPTRNTFDQAVAHHQAGRLPQAEGLYRRLLSSQTNHADALNMLGALLYQSGRGAEGVELVRQAVDLQPSNLVYVSNLALILNHLGRLHEAADVYRKAVALAPASADLQNNLGNVLLAAGLDKEAAAVYTRAAALLPDSPEVFGNLGSALLRSGRPVEAERSYRRSIALRPAYAEGHFNLGLSCGIQSKWDDAIDAFRQAIRLRPDYADAYNNLGNALSEKHKFAEAEPIYRKAIELRPDFAQAHNNLGIALTKFGRYTESIATFRKALELRPANRNVLYHLANALKEDGRPEEALAAAREAIALKPDDAESHITMSLIYSDRCQWEEAYASARLALAARPDWAPAHNNLGYLLRMQGRNSEALALFEKALSLDPHCVEASINLATVYHELGRLDEAIATFERIFESTADSVDGLMNYANSLKDTGQISACVAVCRRAAALTSDPLKIQNLMLAVHYDPALSAAEIYEINRNWGRSLSYRVQQQRRPHHNPPEEHRRLKIGYVSPDFRHHVVAYNVLPLFECHDHAHFEVFGYSNTPRDDEMTNRFKAICDHWRDIKPLSDSQAADLIRQDGVDILIDLSLHTALNRLGVFARKPAPVQFTFAGYPGTTGLPEIDYRITDPYLDPPGTDGFYTETSIRLANSFWCYRPLNRDQNVGPLPVLKNGFITFGALTNFCKINDVVLALWAKVLVALPTSRMLLIARPGSHRDRLKSTLACLGVAPDRIEFLDYRPRAEYLETYHRIDIALDTFPYNGHTTSLDSYWMGVPVVTLMGSTAVSRAGFCQLSNLGLSELAAHSEVDFVRIAAQLAANLPRLSALRSELRPRMERSPLMNFEGFARSIEAAYRQAWRIWCEKMTTDIRSRQAHDGVA